MSSLVGATNTTTKKHNRTIKTTEVFFLIEETKVKITVTRIIRKSGLNNQFISASWPTGETLTEDTSEALSRRSWAHKLSKGPWCPLYAAAEIVLDSLSRQYVNMVRV